MKQVTWTSRSVHFDIYPRTLPESLMEALVDHYWDRPAWVRRFIEPGIGSRNAVVEVSGMPWWMPKWWALRTVVGIATRTGVTGSARYVTERVTLKGDE